MRFSRTRLVAATPALSLAASFSVFSASAQGIVAEWTGATNSAWTLGTNWAGGTAANADTDVAKFGGSFTNQPSVTTNVPSTTTGVGVWLATGVNQNVTIDIASGVSLGINPPASLDGFASTGILLNDTANRNLTFTGAGGIKLLNPATFRVNNAGTLAIDSILSFNGRTVTLAGNDAAGKVNLNGTMSGGSNSNLVVTNAGIVTLSGTVTRDGSTTVNGARVVLDYSTNDTSKFTDIRALTLNGATITLKGGSHMEVVNNVAIGSGLTQIQRDTSAASFRLNALTRSGGGLVNLVGTGIANTDTLNNTAGIIGSWAIVNGADFATNSTNAADGTVTAFSGYAAFSGIDLTTTTAISTLTGSDSTTLATADKATFALKINTTGVGESLTLASGRTLHFGSASSQTVPGGILFVGAHDYTITGGNLKGGGNGVNAQEVVFSNFGTGKLTIASTIQNRGTGTNANSTTFAGPGTFVVTGNNGGTGGYRGQTYISGSTVEISSNANLGGNSGSTYGGLTINGGTLRATDTLTLEIIDGVNTYQRGISIANAGATFDVASGKALTATGVVSNTGALTKTGLGRLDLQNVANTYTGRTYVNQGILSVSGSGSINSTAGLYINGGTVSYNSSAALTAPVTFIAGTLKGTGTVGTAVVADTGDILAPGNSVGAQTYSAGLTFAGGGTYQWELSDAEGTEGNSSGGWDILNVTGGLDITATAGSKFTIQVVSLTPANATGAAANFDPDTTSQWRIVDADTTIDDFDASKFNVITTGFANLNVKPARWSIVRGDAVGGDDTELYLAYVVPEPASLSLLGLAGLACLTRRRTR